MDSIITSILLLFLVKNCHIRSCYTGLISGESKKKHRTTAIKDVLHETHTHNRTALEISS